MAYTEFSYGVGAGVGAFSLGVSILADQAGIACEIEEDAGHAGLLARRLGPLALAEPSSLPGLGELVFVDCPNLDGAAIAALAQLDARVDRAGGRMIVATSLASLDAAFGCCAASEAQILVDPRRAERVDRAGPRHG